MLSVVKQFAGYKRELLCLTLVPPKPSFQPGIKHGITKLFLHLPNAAHLQTWKTTAFISPKLRLQKLTEAFPAPKISFAAVPAAAAWRSKPSAETQELLLACSVKGP